MATCVPVLVQPGDLRHYAENPDSLTFEVPAVFVTAEEVDIAIDGLQGGLVYTQTRLRLVLVESWDQPDEVTDTKTACAQELAQAFLDEQAMDMDADILDYTVLRALPVSIELEPPEDAIVSQNRSRQLWAAAVTVDVLGFAARG